MPKRKESLTEKVRPYHIRGTAVEGIEIFEREEDRARFVFQMYAANIGRPVINMYRKNISLVSNAILQGEEIPEGFLVKEHEPLVHVFSFVLGKDRYHLGLVAAKKDGIPVFMQKLNLGFAKYYNLKYKRRGMLFHGRFKSVAVVNPRQLETLMKFINIKKPADFHGLEMLQTYSYSSFPDLFAERRSHLISQESRSNLEKLLGQEFFAPREDYMEDIKEFENEGKILGRNLLLE